MFLKVIKKSIIFKFFEEFTNHIKKTNRTVVFSDRPFIKLFKNWDHRRDLPTIWNTRLLQTPIEEFFRTTTGILVLEEKTGKEIPQSLSFVLNKVFSKQFRFTRSRSQHLWVNQ